MNIERVLKMARGESELETLRMILGNRIDHGSELGGLISVKQFDTLAADILHWRKATSQAAVLTVTTVTVDTGGRLSTDFTAVRGSTQAGEFVLLIEPVSALTSLYNAPKVRLELLRRLPDINEKAAWFAAYRDEVLERSGVVVFPVEPHERSTDLHWGERTSLAAIARDHNIDPGQLEALCPLRKAA